MERVLAYFRPTDIEEALELLGRPGATPIGGGTRRNPGGFEGASPGAVGTPHDSERTGTMIVDLQALRLSGIRPAGSPDAGSQPGAGADGGGGALIGATTSLQEIADNDVVPATVREAARRERPSTLRTQATIGGLIASGDPDSELLAALLAHDAVVTLTSRDTDAALVTTDHLLTEVLDHLLPIRAGALITTIWIATTGTSAAARTARTDADRPIVAAVVRRGVDGRTRAALTGLGDHPILLDVDGPADLEIAHLAARDDFRGSSEYRNHLAHVLVSRAAGALGATKEAS